MAEVKIRFDANQDYQIRAVESVVRLFEGIERQNIDEFSLTSRPEEDDKDTIPNLDELEEINTALIKENFDNV